MNRYVIARTADVPEGGRLLVDIKGKSIGIFRVNGHFYALLNRCPHQGAELCKGAVSSGLTSDVPGEFRFDYDNPSLLCPWHGWEFDLATGRSFVDPRRTRVRSYDVEVARGSALARERADTDDAPRRVPGPYVAEVVDVSAIDDYIVLTF